MQAFTKTKLSASTNGKGIIITSTGSLISTTIHTATSGTSAWDEIWIYASSNAQTVCSMSLEWGETTPSASMTISIPIKAGRVLIVDGRLLQNGLSVTAYAETAGSICLDGFVNQIV